ncbi:hypothetical protein AXK11_08830 [Cephaloticoccus primus]|uniref:PEP-CTERM protein-sorting domain-containing protein n=1 Tax=Cephaloticoccus primus TaxID=1548207 RepID=A0A139SHW3_9BACT|nr:hypothetical protein AXK11_08830 [Cephaloticoccus primus]
MALPANQTNPLVGLGGHYGDFPFITLMGGPPGLPNEEAILRFGGNTKQSLRGLQIQDRGVVDFVGGALNGKENILYLDALTISGADAQLIIRNWDDRADYLLVRRSYGDVNIPPILNQIHFEGYGPAMWREHYLEGYSDYWQITPMPEPGTYGAIFGSLAFGLIVWRNKRRRTE